MGTIYLAARRGVAHIPAMDRSAEVELAALRRMTATEKMAVMHGLWRQAWALAAAGVRGRHPDWPDTRIEAEVRALFSRDNA